MSSKTVKDPEFLSTLERGLRVLKSFSSENPEMQLSEVSEHTNLSPAVARRCLNTLLELGYVGKNGRKFLLLPKTLEFGSAFLSSMNIEQVATPFLQAVRDITGDSTSLAILSGPDILYLAHVSTNRKIRLGANVGTRFPAYATSLGRVVLAYKTDEEINEYFDNVKLVKLTDKTVTDRDELIKRMQTIRMQGYESVKDELDYGVLSVAVPITDYKRNIVAAINCSTNTTRIEQKQMIDERLPHLRETAIEIEAALKEHPSLIHALNA